MKNTIIITIYIVLLFCGLSLKSQVNLVMNPSFELIDSCPSNNNQIRYSKFWDTLRNGGGGTSDLFHECCSNPSICGMPANIGYQTPKTGVSYAGIIPAHTHQNLINFREYAQGTLLNSLINGNTYCVTFYINLSEYSKYSVSTFCAYLDNGTITAPNDRLPNPSVNPQIFNSQQFDDTLNWVKIQGSFVADGTETYITIGNFLADSLSGITNSYPLNSFIGAYYYIDDVSVIDISTPAFAGNDTIIIKGDAVYLGRPSEIGLDEACIWFLNGVPIDTAAGIMVAPDSTTTYVLEQTICGNVQYDTVTVTVDTSTATAFTHFPKQEIKVFPNPTNGELFFSSGAATEIIIFSIDGRLLHREESPGSNGKQKIEFLFEKGSYIVLLKTEDGLLREKVVVY